MKAPSVNGVLRLWLKDKMIDQSQADALMREATQDVTDAEVAERARCTKAAKDDQGCAKGCPGEVNHVGQRIAAKISAGLNT